MSAEANKFCRAGGSSPWAAAESDALFLVQWCHQCAGYERNFETGMVSSALTGRMASQELQRVKRSGFQPRLTPGR